MPFYEINKGITPRTVFGICLNVLILCLSCRLGDAAIAHRGPGRPYVCSETCHTEVCGNEALRLIKLMDEQADPCANFYEFACGNFMKTASIEEGDNTILDNAQREIDDYTKTEVTANIEDTDLEAFQKTKIYFQNCINEARTEQAGSRPLLEMLNKIGGWPVLLGNRWNEREYNWMNTVYEIENQKIVEFYFPATIEVKSDNRDSSRNAVKVSGPSLVIDANYFQEGQNGAFLQAYLDSMIQTVTALGATNDSNTQREMQQVLDLEVKLYKLLTPEEKLTDMWDEETTIAGLSSKYPGIPWLEFINKVLRPVNIVVDYNEKVYVLDPGFLSGVVDLARNTPKRVIANYLAWRVAKNLLSSLSQEFSDIENEFQSVVGSESGGPREVQCFNEVVQAFPVSVSAMFVRKYYDQSTKRPIAEMFSNLKSTLRKNLQQNNWMDDITRRKALEKIDAMNATIGYTEELMDDRKIEDYYKDLQLNIGSYLQSSLNVSHFLKVKNYGTLRKSNIKNKWSTKGSAAVLNAYYVGDENGVEIPAGTIKGIYKEGRPKYIDYGWLGTMVGHEIMHGFDSNGRKYDKQGNKVNWWEPSAEAKFKDKARCIIDQFSNFTVEAINMNVNGEFTQAENIADNGGFRAAYLAYEEWTKQNGQESCLPSLNYTPRQMFWISAATGWCGKKMLSSLKDGIATDEHSPNDARIIVTLSNYEEFARDFNCPVGSRMNPEKKCTMW